MLGYLYRRRVGSAAAFACLLSATPVDAGSEPAAVLLPGRGLARRPLASYAVQVPSPVDQGVVGFVGARGARATSRYLYRPDYRAECYTLTVLSPIDLGIDYLWVADVQPARAPAPQRAANAAYQAGLFATPVDQGVVGFVGARGARATSRYLFRSDYRPECYALIVASPGDLGIDYLWVSQVWPKVARATKRTGVSAYSIAIAAPRDTPGDLAAFPDPFAATVVSTVDPFTSTAKMKGN